MDYASLIGGLASMYGKGGGGGGGGGTSSGSMPGVTQTQSQVVSQTQANSQNVNIGSTIGQPTGGDFLSNLMGWNQPSTVSIAPQTNYRAYIIGGLILVGGYLYLKRKS